MKKILIALLVIVLVVALVPAVPAVANPPVITVIQIDDTIPDAGLCAFPVQAHFKATLHDIFRFDQNGNPLSDSLHFANASVTFTNVANGKSFSTRAPSTLRVDFKPDGSITVTIVGLTAAITVPGQGVIFLQAGKIVFDGAVGGPILFQAGPQDLFSGNTQALCAALQ